MKSEAREEEGTREIRSPLDWLINPPQKEVVIKSRLKISSKRFSMFFRNVFSAGLIPMDTAGAHQAPAAYPAATAATRKKLSDDERI